MTETATPEQERLEEFVRFSAVVTGFSEFDLWGTGQAEAYYQTVLGQQGADAFLKTVNSDLSADPVTDPLVKSIIKLWYVGVWYGPELTGRTDVAAWTAPGRSGSKPAVPDESQPDAGQPDAGQPDGSQSWQSLPAQRQSEEGGVNVEKDRKPPFVVSPTAYTEGLLWRAIGAHPSGAKAPGYGSWAEPPAIEDPEDGEIA